MKLTIKRSEWLHGEGGRVSRLLRATDNKMCCLGFLGIACGLTRDEILGKSEPSEITSSKWIKGLILDSSEGTETCHQLMMANDSLSYLFETKREARIISLFAELDVQVEFVE